MITGIINLKKEAGMTSNDAVLKLRKILQEKKIGHGGTLDPDVVGVLPIAVGKATRIIEYMMDSGKVYQGQITLGFSTTTEDAGGQLVDRTPVTDDLSEKTVDLAMQTFIGRIEQKPPMYSAVKVKGRRLYDYARRGETVERPVRQVSVYEFIRTSPLTFADGTCSFSFRLSCSKGTYVRTLAVDLGAVLGYASHMSFLERTASSGLELEEARTLSAIQKQVDNNDFSFLLPLEYGVRHLPSVDLNQKQADDLSHGRKVKLERQEKLLVGFYEDRLLAVLTAYDEGKYKPHKVFV
ncbi:tRNA pseudouridine(55) synthase TruB [Streptococcus sp. H31]|uniref:tRNA pseudouridine(55) synthase TruB n=1 Tax=Streptococcus huangxiaojuni TaxID=3237239 RepID=UPI0034A280D4